ncbi:protein transparent testa 12 [Hordeum vulgare]|nr:protein transparent testa 12 [Hordeum vulgare]
MRHLARYFCRYASGAPIKCDARHAPFPRLLFLFLCHARLHRSSAPPPTRHHAAAPPTSVGLPRRPAAPQRRVLLRDTLRLSLGTYETTNEAARAFHAAAWRLGRPRGQMNFQDVYTLQQALDVAPPPRLNTAQDREEHASLQCRLLVAQEDERVMAEWRRRHPEDVAYEQDYWTRRREERLDRRRRKALANAHADIVAAGGRSFFTENDDRWLDIWLSTSDDTDEDDDGDDGSD